MSSSILKTGDFCGLVLFVIFSGTQSIAGIVAETKSVTGEPRTFALALTDPTLRPSDISLPAPQRTWKSPGHTYYYVDSGRGDDANDGLSEVKPWRSLNRINVGEFAAGDKILLRAGSTLSRAVECEPKTTPEAYGHGVATTRLCSTTKSVV